MAKLWPFKANNWSFWPHFLDYMDFKFVLPLICINIDGQTNLKVNQTQISHFIQLKLNPLKMYKNGHISVRVFLKGLLWLIRLIWLWLIFFHYSFLEVTEEIPEILMYSDFWVRPPKLFGQFLAKSSISFRESLVFLGLFCTKARHTGINGRMDQKPSQKCWYMSWSWPPKHSSKFCFRNFQGWTPPH